MPQEGLVHSKPAASPRSRLSVAVWPLPAMTTARDKANVPMIPSKKCGETRGFSLSTLALSRTKAFSLRVSSAEAAAWQLPA